MSNLIEFLTSKEIITVYIISGLACLICFIIYLVEKNNEKLRRRHNTKELNKLVKEIKSQTEEYEENIYHKEPVLEVIEEEKEASSVVKMLEDTGKLKPIVDNSTQVKPYSIEPVQEKSSIKELEDAILEPEYHEEELEYTSIEPDQETARLELKKLEEELIRREQEEKQEINNKEIIKEEITNYEPQQQNIKLTNYEEEQEAKAIISVEELVKKGKEIYAANELSQYKDEGNEPISIQDLEKQMERKASNYEEPFIIENVLPKNDLKEVEVLELEEKTTEKVSLSDFQSINTKEQSKIADIKIEKKFQSSPIISPIFGIERINNAEPNDLELENTANYEKLDAEIKKTNEFLMTLKELQQKLD